MMVRSLPHASLPYMVNVHVNVHILIKFEVDNKFLKIADLSYMYVHVFRFKGGNC